jgi:hypothetical protein
LPDKVGCTIALHVNTTYESNQRWCYALSKMREIRKSNYLWSDRRKHLIRFSFTLTVQFLWLKKKRIRSCIWTSNRNHMKMSNLRWSQYSSWKCHDYWIELPKKFCYFI